MSNLEKFTNNLKYAKFDAFILNSKDEFLDEFVPENLNRLKWLTGFSGSNGIAVITENIKVFFTDGRYLTQARQELDEDFEILDLTKISFAKWLASNIEEKSRIGYDAKSFATDEIRKIKKIIQDYNLKLYRVIENPIDLLWERDVLATEKVQKYPLEYAGLTTKQKIAENRTLSALTGKEGFLTCDTASICWLLNIRANDSKYTPILHGYFLYNNRESLLFADVKKFDQDLLEYLASMKVTLLDLKEVACFAENCSDRKIRRIYLDVKSVSYYFYSALKKADIPIIKITDPLIAQKSIKNSTEIDSIIKAHQIDAVAKTKFLFWLENHQNRSKLDEIKVADKLLEFRKENQEFLYPSFETIAGFAENGAIIHYNADEKSNRRFDKDSLLLIDSGGQYNLGTTDVTRTIAIGDTIKAEQKRNYTLVLKGHIALAMSIFPKGTSGAQIDGFARQFLWQDLKDYAHGTGHGVGCFLNVHEGPQSISSKAISSLKAGMVISNEPGIYIENEYGIRIENLMLVKEETENFLKFETLTLIPLDEKLIDVSLLTKKEKSWLRNYHQKIIDNIGDDLDPEIALWIENKIKLFTK